jgi:hypothetical protein
VVLIGIYGLRGTNIAMTLSLWKARNAELEQSTIRMESAPVDKKTAAFANERRSPFGYDPEFASVNS